MYSNDRRITGLEKSDLLGNLRHKSAMVVEADLAINQQE